MSKLMIVEPLQPVSAVASRGSGAANLLTPDPKDVWADSAVGSPATVAVDLGSARTIDTILLGCVRPPAAGATWSITGGEGNSAETVIQPMAALRVPDAMDRFAVTSHALWTGNVISVRYLAINVTQPAGAAVLTVGVIAIGKAFVADFGREWGSGRQPIDTGSATALQSGGFAVVEGTRKRRCGWTFGDLSIDEADELEAIALALGETRPGVVIEDASRTPGLVNRIWYGKFEKWKAYERRNRRQTRWELGMEEWR